MKKQLKDAVKKVIPALLICIVVMICLIAIFNFICIPNTGEKEVKELVRNYDLTTEENSSNTLIVKNSLSHKLTQSLEEANLQPQIIRYKDYKVVKFNTTEELEEAQTKLQKDSIDVELDTLIDITTSNNAVTPRAIATTTEVTSSTPETTTVSDTNPLSAYLNENPATKQIKVAIIDTGLNPEDEIFTDRILDTNINYSTTGEATDTTDDNGHGTLLAKIIAGKTDKNVKILPIKVANKNGKSTVLSVYMAINDAINQNTDIINISMNTFNTQSTLLREAIDKASAQGIKVVVSSGNLGIDTKNVAPSNIESAIVVGAVHSNLEYEGFSNYGDTLDYCSYGVYDSNYGTSISAAHISAVIAALESTGIQPADIESTMDQYIQDLGEAGKDKYYGKGFISLYTSDECFTVDSEEETQAKANRRKDMLDRLMKADWKNMTDEQFNTLISEDMDTDIVGYFLKSLSTEDFNELTSRDTKLKDPITINQACFIFDTAALENEMPDLPSKDYDHAYEYYMDMCDDTVSISTAGTGWGNNTTVETARFHINLMGELYTVVVDKIHAPMTHKGYQNVIFPYPKNATWVYEDDTNHAVDNLDNLNFGWDSREQLFGSTEKVAFGNYYIGWFTYDPDGTITSRVYSTYRLECKTPKAKRQYDMWKKENWGQATVLGEKHSNGVTWQGLYMRNMVYKKPAHSKLKETPTNIRQGRLQTGYIKYTVTGNTTNDIIGNKLDTAHREKVTFDKIDIQCNSFNCGLAKLHPNDAPVNSTLVISETKYTETININPNGGKYNSSKNTVTIKDLKCGDTTNIPNPTHSNRNAVFNGWKITYKQGTKDSEFSNGTTWKTDLKNANKNTIVNLKATWKITRATATPEINTPPPIDAPNKIYGNLKVHFNAYEYNGEDGTVTLNEKYTYTDKPELNNTASATLGWGGITGDQGGTGNSKTYSALLKPSSYMPLWSIPTGYEYKDAQYKDTAFRLKGPFYNINTVSAETGSYRALSSNDGYMHKVFDSPRKSGYNYNVEQLSTSSLGNLSQYSTYIRVAKYGGKEDIYDGIQTIFRPVNIVRPYVYNGNAYVYRVSGKETFGKVNYKHVAQDLHYWHVVDYDYIDPLNQRMEKDDMLCENVWNANDELKQYHNTFNLATKDTTFRVMNSNGWNLYINYQPKLINIQINANGGTWSGKTTLSTSTGYADCVFRYNIPRKILGTSYAQYGDANANKIEGRNRAIYALPSRPGYEIDWDKTSVKQGEGTCDWDGNTLTYTPNGDLNTVIIDLAWKPIADNFNLTVHKETSTGDTVDLITNITEKLENGKTVEVIDKVDSKTYPLTCEEALDFAVGDGTRKTFKEGLAAPYKKGYTLKGFEVKDDNGNSVDSNKYTITKDAESGIWSIVSTYAGNLHLYPIIEKAAWKFTIDTAEAIPVIGNYVPSNKSFEELSSTNENDVRDYAKLISENTLEKAFIYYSRGSVPNETVVYDPSSSDKNVITGLNIPYGYTIDKDNPNTVNGWGPKDCGGTGLKSSGEKVYHNNDCDGDIAVSLYLARNRHTLTVDANGGEFILPDGSKGTTYKKSIVYGVPVDFSTTSTSYDTTQQSNGAVSTPTKAGNDFKGWMIKDGQGQIEIIDAKTGAIVRVDKDTKEQYTIPDGADAEKVAAQEKDLVELSYPYNDAGSKSKYTNEETGEKDAKYAIIDDVKTTSETLGNYLYYYDNEPNYQAGDDGLNWDGDVTIIAMWGERKHKLTIDNNGGYYGLGQAEWNKTDVWSKPFTVGVAEPYSTTQDSNPNNTVADYLQLYPKRYGFTLGGYAEGSDPAISPNPDLGWTVDKKSEAEISSNKNPISKGEFKYENGDKGEAYYYSGSYDGNVTVKAQWVRNLYNLTIDPNTGGSEDSGFVTKPAGSKTGTVTNASISGGVVTIDNTPYTRKFVFGLPTEFAASAGNRFRNYEENFTDPYNKQIFGMASLPIKKGYTLTGWSSTVSASRDDFGNRISNAVTKPSDYVYSADYAGDVTLKANWTPNTYSINYSVPYMTAKNDENEEGQVVIAGNTTSKTATVRYDSGVSMPNLQIKIPLPTPTLIPTEAPNYGQYQDRRVQYKYETLTGTNYELTLNNGTNDNMSTRDTCSVPVTDTISGQLSYANWNLQAENKTATGWGTSSNFIRYATDSKTYAPGQYVNKANFTSEPNKTVYATAVVGSRSIQLPVPTMRGYIFQHWQGSDGRQYRDHVDIPQNIDDFTLKLTAKWKPIKLNITYHGNSHWNTNQGVYTQSFEFDKDLTLDACKFNRNTPSPGYTFNNDRLKEGYEFVGWKNTADNAEPQGITIYKQRMIGTNQEIEFVDKASGRFNFSDVNNATLNLWAIWKKELSIEFDLKGGKYKNSDTIEPLKQVIWNDTYEHTFDITPYYGTVTENGLNSDLQKIDADGKIYRFLGWSLNPDATEPDRDPNFIVYDPNRINQYTIHDDKVLYAVWEEILMINYRTGSKVGNYNVSGLKEELKNLTAISTLEDTTASTYIKPGEQGFYDIRIASGNPIEATTVFDSKVTGMYSDSTPQQYKDTLNKISATDTEPTNYNSDAKCSLNRKLDLSPVMRRLFNIPIYYRDVYPGDTSTLIKHNIKQNSYYYKNYVNGADYEEININTIVYMEKGSITSIPTLDELKSLIKTRVRN